MNYELLVNQAVEAAQSAQLYANQATEAKSAVEALVVKINDLQITELNNIKQDIKQALINKGQNPTDSFLTYPLLILNIETGSAVDLSFVTASSSQILAGYVGADTNGSPVNGSILHKYSSDVILNQEGSIDIPKGYYLGTEVTLPLSTASIDANEVTTTIGWSKGLTTIVGTLIEGGQINPTTADQTIAKNSFLASAIVVKGLQNFTLENIALGVTMWGKTGTFKGSSTVVALNVAGVLVDDGNGGLKVQKLNFDGTVASDDEEPVTALNFYVFNTGKDEPDYGGSTGGSMLIYKCYSVDTANKTWSGYKAIMLKNNDKVYYEFETEVTSGLLFGKGFTPEIGKIYDSEAVIMIEKLKGNSVMDIAVIYEPFTNYIGSDFTALENMPTFHIIDGRKCMLLDHSHRISASAELLPSGNASRSIVADLYFNHLESFSFYIGYGGTDSDTFNIATFNTTLINYHSGVSMPGVGSLQTGKWYHIAVTFDGAVMKYYIDGVIAGEYNYTYNTNVSDYPLYIGYLATQDTTLFKQQAYIANVGIFDKALNEADVTNLYKEFTERA